MRHLRQAVLAALALTLCAAPVAAARDTHGGGGAVVTPATGKILGEVWTQLYSLPVSENPFEGNGNPCLTVAHKVIQPVGGAPCTIRERTAVTLGLGTACSDVEPPPTYAVGKAAQRACAAESDQSILAATISVDGGEPIDIHRRRFELFSPQRTFELPEDNIFGIPPRTGTLTAHAWGAVIRNLRPGRHVIVVTAEFTDGTFALDHVVTVVARRHR